MTLKITCPSCHHIASIPSHRHPAAVRCPACGKQLRVPQAATAVTTPPLPRGHTHEVKSGPRPPVAVDRGPPATPVAPPSVLPQRTSPGTGRPTAREHDATRRSAVYQFGVATILVAWLGMVPAVIHLLQPLTGVAATGAARWWPFLLLIGGVQVAYAMYAMQLPDWSTVWMTSLFSLLLAAAYAMLVGIALLADEQHPVLQGLGLTDRLSSRRLACWCVVMLTVTGLLAYFGGQLALRWQRVDQRLHAARARRA
jgi:ribosomal protein S27E